MDSVGLAHMHGDHTCLVFTVLFSFNSFWCVGNPTLDEL